MLVMVFFFVEFRWTDLTMLQVRVFLLVFFFQAEDGIRDVAVTGVQTCALPISGHLEAQLLELLLRGVGGLPAQRRDGLLAGSGRDHERHGRALVDLRAGRRVLAERSEERRVGKECRSWWSRYPSENSDHAHS